jgi:hypothetical protein
MGMTNTHNQTLTPEVLLFFCLFSYPLLQVFASLAQIWEPFLTNEIVIYCQFYRWWFQRALQAPHLGEEWGRIDPPPRIPILLVRYEDLLSNQEVPSPSFSLVSPDGLGVYEDSLRVFVGRKASPRVDPLALLQGPT